MPQLTKSELRRRWGAILSECLTTEDQDPVIHATVLVATGGYGRWCVEVGDAPEYLGYLYLKHDPGYKIEMSDLNPDWIFHLANKAAVSAEDLRHFVRLMDEIFPGMRHQVQNNWER